MKIIIYGTGGVGGYFGTRLAQSGNDVTFIARGKHLEAMQEKGLQLKSIHGDHTVFPVQVTNDVTSVATPDLIIIATKTWQLKETAKAIQPILGDHTMVLSLLNGADNAAQLLEMIDEKHVLGGLCKIVSKIEDYGVISHVAIDPFIGFGELDNQKTERVLALQKVFDKAQISNQIPDDIQVAIWSKFLFITTVSAIGGVTRATLGEMRSTPEIRKIMEQTAQEILAIANAKGVNITQETISKAFHFIDQLPYETTASLQRDVLEGRPSELEAQVGTIHRMGEELGILTPANSFIYACVMPQEKKARQES